MPRNLQSKIHSERLTDLSTWYAYAASISSIYPSDVSREDFNDHLIREFNRKAFILNLTGIMFSPYDAGFRFLGSSVDTTYNLVYDSSKIVFDGYELIYA